MSDEPIEQPDQPDDMDNADTANGENPDNSTTGERQAEEKRENDPPASPRGRHVAARSPTPEVNRDGTPTKPHGSRWENIAAIYVRVGVERGCGVSGHPGQVSRDMPDTIRGVVVGWF